MNGKSIRATTVLLTLLPWIGAAVAQEPGGQGLKREPYWYLSFGSFDGGQLQSLENGSSTGNFSGGVGFNVHRVLVTEVELTLFGSTYDSDFGASGLFGSSTISLDTLGVMANVKATKRKGRTQLFAGIGAGFGVTEVGFQDTFYVDYEPFADEVTLLAQLLAGFDVRFKRKNSMGIELRKIESAGEFGWEGERVEVGGESVLVTYRRLF